MTTKKNNTWKISDLFRRFSKENKLKIVDELQDSEILNIRESDLMRMIKEAGSGKKGSPNKTLYLSRPEPGNHWNSTVDSVGIWKKHVYLCFYVQYSNTDTNTDDTFQEFMRYTEYVGRIVYEDRYGDTQTERFTYDKSDKVGVIREILRNYVNQK